MKIILQRENPQLGEQLQNDKLESQKVYYSSAKFFDVEYRVGDCVYLDPDSFDFTIRSSIPKKQKISRKDVRLSGFCIWKYCLTNG